MTDGIVWLNGALLDAKDARIDPRGQGLLFGLGVYDTLRTAGGQPLLLEEHRDRLADGAARLGLTAPGAGQLAAAIAGLLAANHLSDARIRITLAGGTLAGMVPPPGAPQDCLITATPLSIIKPSAALITVPWRRNERSPLAGIKFTACAENVLAQRSALAAGADEALFLNTRDELCEGAFSNVFLVDDGSVVTPPLASGCLPGVTRGIVIELCREAGIPCWERPVSGLSLFPAGPDDYSTRCRREVFLTSSIRGIQPVACLDDMRFTAPGSVTQRLQGLYAARMANAVK